MCSEAQVWRSPWGEKRRSLPNAFSVIFLNTLFLK